MKFNTDDELFEAIPRMERDGQSLVIYAEARSTRTIFESIFDDLFHCHGDAFMVGYFLGGFTVVLMRVAIIAIAVNNSKSGLKR